MSTVDVKEQVTKYMKNNPEKLELLMKTTSPDEVRKVFKEGGFDIDDEAAKSFVKSVQADLAGAEELQESDLEDVNGGFIGTCVIVGVIAGAIIGTCCVGIYKTLKYGVKNCK